VAAILKHLGKDASFCIGHKEYAPGRKDDPSLNMKSFREAVAGFMNGAAPAEQPPIPAVETEPVAGGEPRPTLRRPMKHELVKLIQAKVGVTADGTFGPHTEAAVRAFQRKNGLTPDGIVGPKSWLVIDRQ